MHNLLVSLKLGTRHSLRALTAEIYNTMAEGHWVDEFSHNSTWERFVKSIGLNLKRNTSKQEE